MGVLPRDADAHDTQRSDRCVGRTRDETTRRQTRMPDLVSIPPRIAAPDEYLPARADDLISVVRVGPDYVTIDQRIGDLGQDDDVGVPLF